jgi:preprotein translocase subunit SecG
MLYLMMILMFLVAVFLILLVLVQRGRGGGLAGALGGMGGQSAFGTKAGDLFTKVTVVAAAVWILLCVASIKIFNGMAVADPTAGTSFGKNAPIEPGEGGQGANTPGGGAATPPRSATGTPAAGTPATGAPATGTPAGEGAVGEGATGAAPAGAAPAGASDPVGGAGPSAGDAPADE